MSLGKLETALAGGLHDRFGDDRQSEGPGDSVVAGTALSRQGSLLDGLFNRLGETKKSSRQGSWGLYGDIFAW